MNLTYTNKPPRFPCLIDTLSTTCQPLTQLVLAKATVFVTLNFCPCRPEWSHTTLSYVASYPHVRVVCTHAISDFVRVVSVVALRFILSPPRTPYDSRFQLTFTRLPHCLPFLLPNHLPTVRISSRQWYQSLPRQHAHPSLILAYAMVRCLQDTPQARTRDGQLMVSLNMALNKQINIPFVDMPSSGPSNHWLCVNLKLIPMQPPPRGMTCVTKTISLASTIRLYSASWFNPTITVGLLSTCYLPWCLTSGSCDCTDLLFLLIFF